MAYCPNCRNFVSVRDVMFKPMVCRKCGKRFAFVKDEYRRVTRPGIYIALFIVFNVYSPVDPLTRRIVNVILLILWFAFFIRLMKYLKDAVLEMRE